MHAIPKQFKRILHNYIDLIQIDQTCVIKTFNGYECLDDTTTNDIYRSLIMANKCQRPTAEDKWLKDKMINLDIFYI